MFFKFKKDPEPNIQQETTEEATEEVLAQVSYIMTDESPTPIVDVQLKDYEDTSFNALCTIVNAISSENVALETVNIITEAMLKEGQEIKLIQFMTKLNNETKNKLITTKKKSQLDEVCINPSDMI